MNLRLFMVLALIGAMAAGAAGVDAAGKSGDDDAAAFVRDVYSVGSGDRVKITVFGEKDLSGTYEVSGAGVIAFPLIGEIDVGGKTIRTIEQLVTAKLLEGYLLKPKVNVEVATYRPFYIIGEVNRPGSYAYVEGMKIVNAVALGGGFTYRARKGQLYVRRAGASKEDERVATPDDIVLPGDVIRVDERFF